MHFVPFAFFVACISGPYTVSSQTTSSCSTECKGVDENLYFQTGKSYVYEFLAKTRIDHAGVKKNKETTITAVVTIGVQYQCEFAMKLHHIQAKDDSVKKSWMSKLEAYPLRFSFDDGLITNICPAEHDPIWSVNIKKGILAVVQNAMSNKQSTGYEIDVNGRCPTTYFVKTFQGGQNIYRIKNLLGCSRRRNDAVVRCAHSHVHKSAMKQTSLTGSDQRCRHTIRDLILNDATCMESHVFHSVSERNKDRMELKLMTSQKLTFVESINIDNDLFKYPFERQSLQLDNSEFVHEPGTKKRNIPRIAGLSFLVLDGSADDEEEIPIPLPNDHSSARNPLLEVNRLENFNNPGFEAPLGGTDEEQRRKESSHNCCRGRWNGKAPRCSGKCKNARLVRYDTKGFGKPCFTGKKALCCPLGYTDKNGGYINCKCHQQASPCYIGN